MTYLGNISNDLMLPNHPDFISCTEQPLFQYSSTINKGFDSNWSYNPSNGIILDRKRLINEDYIYAPRPKIIHTPSHHSEIDSYKLNVDPFPLKPNVTNHNNEYQNISTNHTATNCYNFTYKYSDHLDQTFSVCNTTLTSNKDNNTFEPLDLRSPIGSDLKMNDLLNDSQDNQISSYKSNNAPQGDFMTVFSRFFPINNLEFVIYIYIFPTDK